MLVSGDLSFYSLRSLTHTALLVSKPFHLMFNQLAYACCHTPLYVASILPLIGRPLVRWERSIHLIWSHPWLPTNRLHTSSRTHIELHRHATPPSTSSRLARSMERLRSTARDCRDSSRQERWWNMAITAALPWSQCQRWAREPSQRCPSTPQDGCQPSTKPRSGD